MKYHVGYMALGIFSMIVTFVLLKELIRSPTLLKKNYANKDIPTLGGIVLLIAFLFAISFLRIMPFARDGAHDSLDIVVLAIGFGLIGLLDDLVGDQSRQGFKGHISELLKGNVTTGAIKLFGCPIIVAISLSETIYESGFLRFLGKVVAISLIANIFNLLDLSPGRTSKYAFLVVLGSLAITTELPQELYLFFGILIVSLVLDLKERYMLGDTGSNIIGAMIGYMIVSISNDSFLIGIIIIATFLNLLSEFISFSTIIEKCRVLRFFDELGQTPSRREYLVNKRKKI